MVLESQRYLSLIRQLTRRPNTERGNESVQLNHDVFKLSTKRKGLLQPLPPYIKRDTEIRGKFIFRRGIRIQDYRKPKSSMSLPPRYELQCRDGFEEHEIWHGRPRLFPSVPSTTDILPPPILQRETKLTVSSKTHPKKRRVPYDPVKDIEAMRLPSIGELELATLGDGTMGDQCT